MTEKILEVFYDTNALPYKDSAREVHYPIVGSAFTGASNTTQIRFYVRDIGGVADVTWVAVTKLPSGKKLYKLLDIETLTDSESYVYLNLSSEYTQEKGDIYIALNGYQGGVNLEYDSETELYSIQGTPVIMATGNIKIAVAYTPYVDNGYGSVSILDVQDALALVSQKLDLDNAILVVENIGEESASSYETTQLIYSKVAYQSHHFFKIKEEYTIKSFQGIAFEEIIKYIDKIELNSNGEINVYNGKITFFNDIGSNFELYRYYNSAIDYGLKLDLVSTSTRTNLLTFDRFGYLTFNTTLENVYKKTETDTLLNGKVDRLTTSGLHAYTHTGSSQGEIEINVGAVGGSLPVRNANGQIIVPLTPTENNHATSKKYIDDLLAILNTAMQGYGKSLTIDETDFKLRLLDGNGDTLSTIDLPLEELIVDGEFDSETQTIILTLFNGNTIEIPVADLVAGLVSTDDLASALASYYTKSQVDTLLSAKANSDDVYNKTQTDTLLGAKQDTLVSGTNIKTINNTSILGSGNYAFDIAFNELSTNALENQVVSKEFREINYEIAMIREALFEVVLSEIDYSVDYAMTYVVPDSLIDTDGTHRVVYSETQLVSVSGNSVVDNQLIGANDTEITLASGGSYLTTISGTSAITSGTGQTLQVVGGTDMAVDLKKAFTTNTPTTLNDNRVKWLLSRGYIAYNTGSLLSTSVSGLESVGFNQWDEEIVSWATIGSYSNRTGSKNYIPAIPNKTYYIQCSSYDISLYGCNVVFYDNQKNVISNSLIYQNTFSTPNNCYYIKFGFQTSIYGQNYKNDICINISNANVNGTYKPYSKHTLTLPNTELKSAGSVHDYLEVVEGNVIEGEQRYNIVKHTLIGSIDLGTLDYVHQGDGLFNSTTEINGKGKYGTNMPNILCSRYMVDLPSNVANKTTNKTIMLYGNKLVYIYDTSYDNASTLKSSLSGVYLYYELATEPTPTTIATDLTFEQVSLIIQQGGTLNTNFTNVPPNVTTKFVVKKAVGE